MQNTLVYYVFCSIVFPYWFYPRSFGRYVYNDKIIAYILLPEYSQWWWPRIDPAVKVDIASFVDIG